LLFTSFKAPTGALKLEDAPRALKDSRGFRYGFPYFRGPHLAIADFTPPHAPFDLACIDIAAPYESGAAVWVHFPDGFDDTSYDELHVAFLVLGYCAIRHHSSEYLVGIVNALNDLVDD
jgi:hypothetical protein